MSVSVKPIKGVIAGSWGQPIILTVVNDEGEAQDVSGYNTDLLITGLSPDGRTLRTAVGAVVGTGTAGQLSFSWALGDIDRAGVWKVQVEFYDGDPRSELFKTYPTTMEVGESLYNTPST